MSRLYWNGGSRVWNALTGFSPHWGAGSVSPPTVGCTLPHLPRCCQEVSDKKSAFFCDSQAGGLWPRWGPASGSPACCPTYLGVADFRDQPHHPPPSGACPGAERDGPGGARQAQHLIYRQGIAHQGWMRSCPMPQARRCLPNAHVLNLLSTARSRSKTCGDSRIAA